MITKNEFDRMIPNASPQNREAFYMPVINVMAQYKINTPIRVVCFVSQAAHESASFTKLQESLYYSKPERIFEIFKKYFDIDKDKFMDKEDYEMCLAYSKNSPKLANYVYANRMGNGPVESGDGYLNRGRGIGHVTGNDNYSAYFKRMGMPEDSDRDLLLLPEHATQSFGDFWNENKLNVFCDNRDFKGLRKGINGGLIGYDEWIIHLDRCKKVLNVK